jgi:hypothetical protein
LSLTIKKKKNFESLTFEFIRTIPCTVVLRWVRFHLWGVVGHEGSAHFQNWRSHDGIMLLQEGENKQYTNRRAFTSTIMLLR